MKKTLVSALTTALVVGAASTTFAAANPFEDVPADHWAYDAIAQLAADGVIEGYGDGTYRGDQEITRYEMAQMVARAMAKGNGVDKAMIDKLAAEFADELNSLGVRVSALEKKVDNVKWGGRLRYRFIRMNHEQREVRSDRQNNVNQLLLRFEPQMKINEHWTGKARIDYAHWNNMHDAANEVGQNNNNIVVDRMYVVGDYKAAKITLGKLPYKTQADYGMIMDRYFSGGSLVFGKDVKVALNLGRINNANNALGTEYVFSANNMNAARILAGTTSSYGSIEIYNDRAKKFTWGLGWHQFRQGDWDAANGGVFDSGSYNIFALGLGYKFNPDVELTAAFSRANGLDYSNAMKTAGWDLENKAKNSYALQLNYKGAKANKAGSWGAYIAWRQLGTLSSTGWTTYALNGPQYTGSRGFEIGASWAPMKNVVGKLEWFTGKDDAGAARPAGAQNYKVNTIFTEWSFIF
ncbi:MAG: S-layer homology domain-containing protein [Schwartzia sp.]|nr:S-layer homology domain-containing protein [Schwartzia sp. (in: firmicutes)]